MQKNFGISLIEILISLLLVSILLLGIDAAQIASIQFASANYYFAVASQQMSNMNERLKNNDTQNWDKENQEVLPQGHGVARGDEVAIFWGNKNEENCKKNKVGMEGCLWSRVD